MSKKLLTEFIGTFFLVLTISLAVTRLKDVDALFLAPIPIGLMLMAMVYMGGHISGAQYNPAVTLGVFLSKNMPAKDVGPYMVVQVIAAVAAAWLGFFLTGQHPAPMPGAAKILELSPVPGQTVAAIKETAPTIMGAVIVELLFTFALVIVVLNVACTPKCSGNSYFGAAIGLTVAAAAYAAAWISGGAFNPAVGIGLCVVDGLNEGASLKYVWIYLLGPFAGAVLAAVVYKAQHGKQV